MIPVIPGPFPDVMTHDDDDDDDERKFWTFQCPKAYLDQGH